MVKGRPKRRCIESGALLPWKKVDFPALFEKEMGLHHNEWMKANINSTFP